MADFEPIPYRIRIGVTGHRKLSDPAQVQAMVREALATEIDDLFPAKARPGIERIRQAGKTSICFRVLSPLAEGADRVVAQAVLADPSGRLDVVLPLAIEDYLATFESEQSRDEFRELLKRARKPLLLRTKRLQDEQNDPAGQADLRHQAYAHVGQYVVDHCDVLIAIWDGELSRGVGGTAEIVQYAIEQRRPVIRIWGDVIEVLERDKNNGLDASGVEAIDHFNFSHLTPEQLKNDIKTLDHKHFARAKTASEIPATVREFVNRLLFPYYAVASVIAKRNQKTFHKAGTYVYVMSAGAVGCATLGVLFPVLSGLGFGCELVLLAVLSLTLMRAHRKHAQRNWIDHRFLAERLRCGIFMAICGVEPRPFEVLPYMGHAQTDNDWTVRAFDEIWNRLPRLAGCTESECLIFNPYIRDEWIGKQVEFHQKKATQEGRSRKRLRKASEIILPATIVAAALHIFLVLWEPANTALEPVHVLHFAIHQGLSFIALLFPAIAASLAGIEAHREHLRLEKSSANMATQLERVNRQMKSATDPARFEALMHQASDIMLGETQSWLMLMRFVEITG